MTDRQQELLHSATGDFKYQNISQVKNIKISEHLVAGMYKYLDI